MEDTVGAITEEGQPTTIAMEAEGDSSTRVTNPQW